MKENALENAKKALDRLGDAPNDAMFYAGAANQEARDAGLDALADACEDVARACAEDGDVNQAVKRVQQAIDDATS